MKDDSLTQRSRSIFSDDENIELILFKSTSMILINESRGPSSDPDRDDGEGEHNSDYFLQLEKSDLKTEFQI